MGNINSYPVLSQTKSLVQIIAGDEKGARQTQEDFLYRNTFPVLSQICSAGHAIAGQPDTAREVQVKFAEGMGEVANGVPVVGHIKGSIHYAVGDSSGGDKAMKSATRSLGVIIGGAVGTATGGPVGGVMGAISGGVGMDVAISSLELAVNKKPNHTGYIKDVDSIISAVEGKRGYTVDDGFKAVLRPMKDSGVNQPIID